MCTQCPPLSAQLYSTRITSHMKTHLAKEHGIHVNPESQSTEPADNTKTKTPIYRPDKDALKESLSGRLSGDHQPLTTIESPEFRNFLAIVNPESPTFIPICSDTAKNWMIVTYESKKNELKRLLRSERVGPVHISFDGWTSENGYALLGVVSTWLDKEFKAKNCHGGLRHGLQRLGISLN